MSPVSILLVLLSSSQSGLGSVVIKQYKYVAFPRNWQRAQTECRSKGYSDLATIHSESDIDQVLVDGFYAWIGLERQRNRWTWIDGQRNHLDNWGERPSPGDDMATIYSKNQRFYGVSWKSFFFFICQTVVGGIYNYTLIPQSKTWNDAQQYCREKFDDLAVTKDMNSVKASVHQRDFPVWVGLHRDGRRWSWKLGSSGYSRWALNQPGNVRDCASIFTLSKELATYDCSQASLPYLCMKENVVVVKETKTWEEAHDRCQALGYQLLSVQPGDDFQKVRGYVLTADTQKVWTGLRFLAGRWFWSNKATVSDSRLPQCPSTLQRCGALAKSSVGGLETHDCAEKLNFLCYS